MAPDVKPHSSVCSRFCHEEMELSRVGLSGDRSMGLGDFPGGEDTSQALGNMGGVAPSPEPHHSVRFCLDFGRVKPPEVWWAGPSELEPEPTGWVCWKPRRWCQWISCKGGSTSHALRKVGEWPRSQSHTTKSLTPQVFPDLYILVKAFDSSVECEVHRVVQEGGQRIGLLHSLKLMPHREECSTPERWRW